MCKKQISFQCTKQLVRPCQEYWADLDVGRTYIACAHGWSAGVDQKVRPLEVWIAIMLHAVGSYSVVRLRACIFMLIQHLQLTTPLDMDQLQHTMASYSVKGEFKPRVTLGGFLSEQNLTKTFLKKYIALPLCKILLLTSDLI